MEETVIFKEKDGINYIQFKKLLEFGINHCYTLKSDDLDFGEINENNYQEENNGYSKISKAFNIEKKKLFIIPNQVHSDIVKCIDENTVIEDGEAFDGFITDKKGLAITARNADCIIFLFYDPIKRVIASVHSRMERHI